MPRPIILFTSPWLDLPLEELASRASEWGYSGVELACAGNHLELQRAVSEGGYATETLNLLGRYDLAVPVVSAHRIGTAVLDPVDARHKALLPDYVWGDGDPAGVRQRAIQEMSDVFRAARMLGASVVSGFTGSNLWSFVNGFPSPSVDAVSAGLKEFAKVWNPLLDAAKDAGVKFAFEVHPGQIAFDHHSTGMVLDAIGGREEFGLTFDPSHFHWQGVDPVAFIRQYGSRIYHVHIKDCTLTLDGRASVLNSYLPSGDPRRGWQYRAPGRGGIDFEGIVRELNAVGYAGALSVEFHDPGMNRDYGAEEALKFVRRLDFEPAVSPGSGIFR